MRTKAPFANRMTKTQTILGWCWLPVHIAVLPLLLGLYAAVSPDGFGETEANLLYHGLSFVFVLLVFFRFLRAGFDVMLDRPGQSALAALIALGVDYLFSLLAAVVLLALEGGLDNPNNAAVMDLAAQDAGTIRALAVFLAPVTEEVLFRGVAFGALRNRSRALAYVVSALLFSLYHVWQYAVAYADAGLLLYAAQYLPVSIALAWCYERTESIWPPIFAHMIVNAVSFAALSLV